MKEIIVAGIMDKNGFDRDNKVYRGGGINPCIIAQNDKNFALKKGEQMGVEDYLLTAKDGEQYGVFKLTPRECGRLMGVNDKDIDKMFSVNSNSQCYKQYGNSITVPVLMAIFSQLNIKNVRAWNDMTEDERYELIDRTTRDYTPSKG